MRGPIVSALGVAFLAACGGGDGTEWAGTMTDSAGVTLVSNPADGMWRAGSEWRLEDELTIGTTEGDPDYQFGQISGIGVASDGRIFVLDQQGLAVRVFDSEGTLVNQFGRSGNGPGELAAGAGPLIIAKGDTILVPDLRNQRVNRYDVDGTSLGSYRFDLTQGLPARWEVTSSGVVANQIRPIPTQPGVAPDSMDVIATRSTDGDPVDTLLHFPSGRTIQMSGNRAQLNFFAPEPTWTLADDGKVWFAVNDDYQISVYGPGATLERVITKPFTVSPIGDRDKEVITDAILRLIRESGAPPQAVQQFQQMIGFADNFPAFLQLVAGPAGSLWVQRIQVPSELTGDELESYNPQLSLGDNVWDIFDSQGRYLGALDMPERFQPIEFAGQQIYGIWRDELDVQYVKRIRVIGLPAGTDTGAVPLAGG